MVVDSPTPGVGGYLADIDALSASDGWAVGQYEKGPPRESIKTLIERWDGSSWSVVPSPSPGGFSGLSAVLEISPDDVWAAGSSSTRNGLDQTLIEHWDGSAWTVVPSPSPGSAAEVYDLMTAGSSGTVWAVGATQPAIFDSDVPLVEQWNGSKWKVVRAPSPPQGGYLLGGAAISADDAWAVGETADSNSQPLIEHWDGTSWTLVPAAPGTQGFLEGVAGKSGSDVWAVGGGNAARSIVQHWDGSAWSNVSTPRSKKAQLESVAVGPAHDVWAVGQLSTGGHKASTLTERWNGAWSRISSPNGGYPDSSLFAVNIVPGTHLAWAAGISTDGRHTATLIELFG